MTRRTSEALCPERLERSITEVARGCLESEAASLTVRATRDLEGEGSLVRLEPRNLRAAPVEVFLSWPELVMELGRNGLTLELLHKEADPAVREVESVVAAVIAGGLSEYMRDVGSDTEWGFGWVQTASGVITITNGVLFGRRQRRASQGHRYEPYGC